MASDVEVRQPRPDGLPQIFDLHARVFGPGRFTRTAYRIREGTPLISPYCLLARIDGALVAAIRFTNVTIDRQDKALLLGPLAVEPQWAGQGYGRRLIAAGLEIAKADGVRLSVLVGDMAYYQRFGFVRVPPGQIRLPGPADPARILACELEPGALTSYRGLVSAA